MVKPHFSKRRIRYDMAVKGSCCITIDYDTLFYIPMSTILGEGTTFDTLNHNDIMTLALLMVSSFPT